ncbi:hypothetical protein, conserved [Plasmodium gonderi]|uniref:Uncharacterized protein n=1 Tax=Plasmodium gonderi TaxID=77519 RepID=A0A1Y1JMP9_PLAGO|nr:hypothetical protein, conserved [Plasmodium gonderi]GAW81314.1 hypothetical protein, conserved [Plasmodium gonderi]
MATIPHIVILSYEEQKINKFVSYLTQVFEVIEWYENSDKYEVMFDHKNISSDINCSFVFKQIVKVRIVNKYYSAQVIISSCVVELKGLDIHEQLHVSQVKSRGERNPETQNHTCDIPRNKELNAKDILCESVIFLFNDFSEKEKKLINENPFRNYDEECVEYIKDPNNSQKIIRNENFDFSNFYKDVGIKISIFPLFLEKDKRDIVSFFSDYFIECLYINYESDFSTENIQMLQGTNEIDKENKKVKERKKSQFHEFEEEEEEDNDKRLVEALHCHMWKGLQITRDRLIIQKGNFPMGELPKIEKCSQNGEITKDEKCAQHGEITTDEKCAQNGEIITDKKCAQNGEIITDKKFAQNGEIITDKKCAKISEGKKEDLFMENFNKIVEKIKLAKIENKNCTSDSARRKKAEDIIFELQQYFCEIDED